MLTLADKVNLVITSVVAIDGELVVSFADGSEIVVSARGDGALKKMGGG